MVVNYYTDEISEKKFCRPKMIEGALVDVSIQSLLKGLVDKIDAEVQYVPGFEHEFAQMKKELKILKSYLADVDGQERLLST